MSKYLIVLLALAGCGGVVTKTTNLAQPGIPHDRKVCLMAGGLPDSVQRAPVGTIAATKRTYGGTDEVLRAIADEARKFGADAVINLQADQRFKGPLPWRVTSPTGRGDAVRITSPDFTCEGGKLS